MVEQWTENPCVPGSIPGGTTKTRIAIFGFFVFIPFSPHNFLESLRKIKASATQKTNCQQIIVIC
jgi:hypothetical protein